MSKKDIQESHLKVKILTSSSSDSSSELLSELLLSDSTFLEPLLTTAAGFFVRVVGFSSELISSLPLSLVSSLLLLLTAAGGFFGVATGFFEGSFIEQKISMDNAVRKKSPKESE
jgi:hypothetical protein